MKSQKQILAANLQRLLDSRGLDQKDLARHLNVSETSVSYWLHATKYPRIDKIQMIADFFNVRKSDLMEEKSEEDLQIPSFVKIPIIGKIACGDPIDTEENIEGYTFEMAQGLPTGELYALVADGESMAPTIEDGSHVIIQKQSTVDDGQIAAVRFRESGEITLKRIKRQGQTMLLVPDNKDFDPIIVTHENPADIVGRVIRSTRNH